MTSAAAPAPLLMVRGEQELPHPTREWLAAGEASTLARTRFAKRRTEYLLRRWVCKQAIAVASGWSPDPSTLRRIEVANLPSGAPEVRIDGAPTAVAVSIADRAGWAVCAVSRELARVGCDLEIVERRSPAFLTDFLTGSEQTYVASCQGAERDAAANLIWSAKESALKVLQSGLRRDTRSLEVVLEAHRVRDADAGADDRSGWARLEVRPDEGGCLPGWWRRDGVFVVTVVSERPTEHPTALPGSMDLASAEPQYSWLDG